MVSTQVGLCVYQQLHWYNSIIACLYNHHAMCMYALFSIFFSSSRRLKRARSSQKIVIQHHQKRKPAAWRGVRRGTRRGARRGVRRAACESGNGLYYAWLCKVLWLHCISIHPIHTYILYVHILHTCYIHSTPHAYIQERQIGNRRSKHALKT